VDGSRAGSPRDAAHRESGSVETEHIANPDAWPRAPGGRIALATIWRRWLPWTSVAGLALGLGVGHAVPLGHEVGALLEWSGSLYAWLAPIAIYFVLAPSLVRISSEHGRAGRGLALHGVYWLAKVRLAALVFAVAFTAAAFSLPMHGSADGTWTEGIGLGLQQVGHGMLFSPYFWAIYAALATAWSLARRSEHPLARLIARGPVWIEAAGAYLMHAIPGFMFLMGIYILSLPVALDDQIDGSSGALAPLRVLGMDLPTSSGTDLFLVYVAVAALTGIGTTLWHAGMLAAAKRAVPSFSVRKYLARCFVRVYPLLWATSSEALATPLVLHLMKESYPELDAHVRRFCVGLGTFLNINGTLICVFVLATAISTLVGHPIGWFDLLLLVPIAFILGYGVPGIPGELALFAGPIMPVLGVPEPLQPSFLVLFLGMQIGLPDAFRTGGNTTDVFPATLILNQRHVARQAVAATSEAHPGTACSTTTHVTHLTDALGVEIPG
jgi:hypothetical protein